MPCLPHRRKAVDIGNDHIDLLIRHRELRHLAIAQGVALDARERLNPSARVRRASRRHGGSLAARRAGRNRAESFPALESSGTRIFQRSLRTRTTLKEREMSRHPDFAPQGVILAVLLPFLDICRSTSRASELTCATSGRCRGCLRSRSTPTLLGSPRAPRTSIVASCRSPARKSATAADHSRCLGGRQPGGGADRSTYSGRRGFGAVSVSAGSLHARPVGRDGAGPFQDHRRCRPIRR
jgi:hypothetical protein